MSAEKFGLWQILPVPNSNGSEKPKFIGGKVKFGH